jgi:hypothetical protein
MFKKLFTQPALSVFELEFLAVIVELTGYFGDRVVDDEVQIVPIGLGEKIRVIDDIHIHFYGEELFGGVFFPELDIDLLDEIVELIEFFCFRFGVCPDRISDFHVQADNIGTHFGPPIGMCDAGWIG